MNKILIIPEVRIEKEKLRDVDNLLTKHFGANWQQDGRLVYYKDLIGGANDNTVGMEVNYSDYLSEVNEAYKEPTV